MWRSRFFGIMFSALALLAFMGSQTALAAYPTSSESSMSQQTRGLDGSFQLAVMGCGAVPLDIPKSSEVEKACGQKTESNPKSFQAKKEKSKKSPGKKTGRGRRGFSHQNLQTTDRER